MKIMKTRNILLGMVAAAAALLTTGCYEKFNTPPEQKIYDDEWFTDHNYQYKSIIEVKALFGDPSVPASYNQAYYITENYYIKGKVISNDEFGNFYRNLFIQDASGAIELKVGITGMYSKYVPGQTIYVVCQDLALGNYTGNLSLGLPEVEGSSYANKNIEVKYLVDVHLKQGERTTFAVGDTLVVNAANVAGFLNDAGTLFKSEYAGRLIRFEGAVSTWGTFSGTSYPSFMYLVDPDDPNSSYSTMTFTDLYAKWDAYDSAVAAGDEGTYPGVPRPANFYEEDRQPTWAYQEYQGDDRYFGSARYTVGDTAILIRTSGYSRFALDHVTPNGEAVDITGILNLYTYTDGRYPANQIVLNTDKDVK